MKKIFTILCLMALTLGAQAGVVTDRASAGNPVPYADFIAGKGAKYGLMMTSTNANTYKKWCGFTTTVGNNLTISPDHLFILEESTTTSGKYWLKRYSTNEYLSANNTFGSAGVDLTVVQRNTTDNARATEYDVAGLQISFDNASGNHYNCGRPTMEFYSGAGAFSTYVAYGPFYVVRVKYLKTDNTEMQAEETLIVTANTTINAPAHAGYTVDKESETVSADGTVTFTYTEAASYDYTLSVVAPPAGTTMTIGGVNVAIDAATFSSASAVTENDVVLTFPSEYSKWSYTVSISGTTITVTCREPWYVSFDKETLRSTHASRYTDKIGFASGPEITFSGAVGDLIWRDLTAQELVVPAGTTLTPLLGYRGWSMYGYLYIDYNNDGDFKDDGELVSQSPNGNAWASGSTADKTIPEFTITNTPGTYRARYKVEWNNPNPHEIGSNIAENGGCVIDVMIKVVAAADVTFKVVDANNNPLLEETVSMPLNETVTDLPSGMKRAFTTYTYNPTSLTVTADASQNVFTATATFNLPFEPSTSFDNAKWYYATIRNTKYIRADESKKDSNGRYQTNNANEETDVYKWAFFGNPYSNFWIANKEHGAGKYLTAPNATNPTMAEVSDPASTESAKWEVIANDDGFTLRSLTGDTKYINDNGNTGCIGYWNSTNGRSDVGGKWKLTKVPENAITYIEALNQLDNSKVYAIYNVRAMWKMSGSAMTVDPISGIDFDEVYTNPGTHQIAIVKQNDKLYLYSVTDQKYLASNNKLYDSPLEAVNIVPSTNAEATIANYKWFFSFEGYTDKNINTNSNPAIEINYWNSHDIGNTNAIMETTGTYDLNTALAAFNDYTQCITDYCDLKGIGTDFASHIGELGYPKAGTTATTAFTDILDRNASDENTAEDWNTLKAKYSALVAPENIVLPETGKFYRIKGVVSGRYMQSNACTTASNENTQRVGVRLGATETADASTIFYLDTDNKLLGYSNGLYVTNTCDINAVDGNLTNATQYTFVARGLNEFAVKNGGTFLYSWSGNDNICFDRQGSDADACRMTIEPVNELPITLKEVGGKYYATFSAPVDIASITGADAFNVEVSDDNKMASTKPIDGDGLKAGNGVVLIGTTNKATATIGAAAATATTNLKPQYASEPAATHNDAGHFFLGTKQNNEGTPVIGFYKLKSDGGKTGGFKAYIEKNPAQSSAPAVEGFMLVFDGGVTGIENMEHGAFDNGAVYNLQGQRVTKATKGVFIQNGKKVVLK